jgi:hypothetical protein
MIRLGHITAMVYLTASLILTASIVSSFINEGFSVDPQGGSMPPAKPPSITQPLVPQPTKNQDKIGPDVKSSINKQGNIILSSDISNTEKIDTIVLLSLKSDIHDYQIGFFDGYRDGYKLAKNKGSVTDLLKMKKTTDTGVITGLSDIKNVGYDRGLSNGYAMGDIVKTTTSEKPK